MDDLTMTAVPSLSAVQFNSERILPFDIVQTIFSFIEQADCLECMMVSRVFFQAVPQYCSLNWETVNFTKSKVINERFWLCLGPHVRHITLTEDIGYIFDQLIKYNCCHIESIKFNRCSDLASTTDQTYRLIKGVHHISPQGLDFHKISSDVPILEILAVSPKLKRFRCTYARDRFEHLDHPNQWYTNYDDDVRSRISSTLSLMINSSNRTNSNRNNVLANVTNLCLDARMEKLMAVIKLCPNVQNLHIWLQWPGLQNMSFNGVDLDHVFLVCSRLNQLQYYWPDKDESSSSSSDYHWKYIPHSNVNNDDPYTGDIERDTTTNSANNNTDKERATVSRNEKLKSQLKSLFNSVTVNNPPREIIKVIRQHQQNLECIKINNYDIDFDYNFGGNALTWDINNNDNNDQHWNRLANVHAKQLIELVTRGVPWQNHNLSSFLSHCSFLQYLSIYNVDASVLEYQPLPARPQQSQPQRQQQRYQSASSHRDNLLPQAFSALHHLRSFEFVLNSKSLKRTTTQHLCTVLQVISDAAPNLENLVVSGFHVLTDPILSVVSSNRNLRVLRLGSGDMYRRKNRPTTDKGIHQFIQNLSPHIQFLDLTNLKLSSQTLFEELAERTKLTKLVLNSCGAASPEGLRSFLTRKVNSLIYLRMDSCHIEHRKELIEYCKNQLHYTTRENRNQLFVSR